MKDQICCFVNDDLEAKKVQAYDENNDMMMSYDDKSKLPDKTISKSNSTNSFIGKFSPLSSDHNTTNSHTINLSSERVENISNKVALSKNFEQITSDEREVVEGGDSIIRLRDEEMQNDKMN